MARSAGVGPAGAAPAAGGACANTHAPPMDRSRPDTAAAALLETFIRFSLSIRLPELVVAGFAGLRDLEKLPLYDRLLAARGDAREFIGLAREVVAQGAKFRGVFEHGGLRGGRAPALAFS